LLELENEKDFEEESATGAINTENGTCVLKLGYYEVQRLSLDSRGCGDS
jgi:hypothetical protein